MHGRDASEMTGVRDAAKNATDDVSHPPLTSFEREGEGEQKKVQRDERVKEEGKSIWLHSGRRHEETGIGSNRCHRASVSCDGVEWSD
jgi:hypothetical protein